MGPAAERISSAIKVQGLQRIVCLVITGDMRTTLEAIIILLGRLLLLGKR